MSGKWSGTYVKRARAYVADTLPAPCRRCGRLLSIDSDWTVGHIVDAAIAPELEHDPANWSAECRRCNLRAGAILGNRMRKPRPRPTTYTSREW